MGESAFLAKGDRIAGEGSDVQQFGNLVINRVERRVLVGDREVHLTPSEFRLLSTLAAEPQRAFSGRELLEAMWESPWRTSTGPLQIHVSRLRKKLATAGAERNFLTTIHGFGYRFDPGPNALLDDPPHDESPVGLSAINGVLSADGTILWIGASVQDELGWRPSEVVGRSACSLVHLEDLFHVRDVQLQVNAGKSAEFVGRVAAADGRFRAAQFSIRPVRDGDGDSQMCLVDGRTTPSVDGLQELWGNATPSSLPVPNEVRAGTVRLFFDRSFTLREIRPHAAFLGFHPDAIIGTFFRLRG